MQFIRFFIGTPRRFLATVVVTVVLMIWVHLHPGVLAMALAQLFNELVMPLAGPFFLLCLIFGAFRVIFGGMGGGRRH